jgi:hypothetical protein
MRKVIFPIFILLLSLLAMQSCNVGKKPHLDLKTDSGYVSANCAGYPGGQFKVGLIADKAKHDLSTVFSEVAYDGAASSHIVSTFEVGASTSHCEKDFTMTLRNQSGTERWFFGSKDKAGKVSMVQITISVP